MQMIEIYKKISMKLKNLTSQLWIAFIMLLISTVVLTLMSADEKLVLLFFAITLLTFGLVGSIRFFSEVDLDVRKDDRLYLRIRKRLRRIIAWVLAVILTGAMLMLFKLIYSVIKMML